MLRFLLAFSILCSVAQAEITITTANYQTVTGVKVVNGQVIVDGKVSIANVCSVNVTTPSKFVDLVARRFIVVGGVVQIESADVVSTGTRTWQIKGNGTYGVEVVAFDPVTGIERKSSTVTIESDKPIDPDVAPLTGLQKESRDAIAKLVAMMSNDMKQLSLAIDQGKYKTVIDASAASNVSDEATRTTFKRAMGKAMQPLLGTGVLPPDAPKIFSDIAVGFGAVK